MLTDHQNPSQLFSQLLVGVLAAVFLITPFNGLQLILLGLCLAGYWASTLIRGEQFHWVQYDWVVVGLLAWMTSTLVWATNISLSWNPLFIFLCLAMMIPVMRQLWPHHHQTILYVIWTAFAVSLVHQLFAIHYEIPYDQIDWNKFLFKNRNYTTAYIIGLYPFLVFSTVKSKFLRFLKVISGVMLAGIILFTQANGAGLALLFLLGYFFVQTRLTTVSNRKPLAMAVLVGIPIVLFLGYSLGSISSVLYGGQTGAQHHLIDQSIATFMRHPFHGVGLGNWLIESYQYAPDAIKGLDNRMPNHNLYFGMLAELGFVGVSLFLTAMLLPLYWVLSKADASWQAKAAGGTILVYAITTFFYRDASSYVQHFSALQFLAFGSIGVITKECKPFSKISKIGKIVLFFLAVMCSIWFFYERSTFIKGSEIIRLTQQNADRTVIENKIRSVYHPIFTTHYGNLKSYDAILLEVVDEQEKTQVVHRLQQADPYHKVLAH